MLRNIHFCWNINNKDSFCCFFLNIVGSMKTRKMDWKPGRNSKIAGSSRRTQIYTELMLLLGLTFFVEPVQMARLIPYLQRSSKSCCSGLQYMFNCPVIFRNLKTLLIYSLVKCFSRIFEICFFVKMYDLKFSENSESFRAYNVFRKWCVLECANDWCFSLGHFYFSLFH